MLKGKITTVGNSVGMVLPKEALAKLNVEKGDHVFLTETENGFEITSYDPAFERQLQVAARLMKKHRHALRELAK